MHTRLALLALCALVAPPALGAPAAAQNASPTPAPTPVAFSAQAHADVTVVTANGTFSGSAVLGVAQRDRLVRIDVVSIKSDSFPIPPLTATVVLDRRANTMTLWSDVTRKYRVQSFLPRALASATPRASPRATAKPAVTVGTSPFAKLDVMELTVKLTGHTTTAGLATTGISLDLQARKTGENTTAHVTAVTQLADEYLAFPVTIDAAIEPGTSPNSAKLSYAVDRFSRDLPPPARFAVPAGYTQAGSLFEVILPRRSATYASPAPTAPARPN